MKFPRLLLMVCTAALVQCEKPAKPATPPGPTAPAASKPPNPPSPPVADSKPGEAKPKAAVPPAPVTPMPAETKPAPAPATPAPAAPAAPSSSSTFVLFDGKSIDDWQPYDAGGSGNVELHDEQMIIGTGESITGAIYKKAKDLPVTNYEITLEAQRLEGLDFFCGLTFPVGDLKTCATLVLGGWGGSVTGISSIDGMDASENSTGHYRKFDDKKWYTVKLRVTPANISAWVGEEKVIDVDTEGKKIGVRPGPIEDFTPLSLTTFQTTAAIRNIKLTPLPAAEVKK